MAASTFAEVVATSSKSIPKASDLVFPTSYQSELDSGSGSLLPVASRRAGKPALLFSDEEHIKLTDAMKLTLVIKFYTRHPKMELVRDFFSRLGLIGNWTIGQLDPRHMLLRLSREEDYTLVFGRRGIAIDDVGAKVLKWTSDFDFRKESPVIPIWLKFPGLRAHYFNKRVLFSLAAAYGKPLKLDAPTFNFSRPSCARVLVELDITSTPSPEIWIGTHHSGYWQEVVFEDVPIYCKRCCIFGHKLENCYIAHPELQPANFPHKQTKANPLPPGKTPPLNDNPAPPNGEPPNHDQHTNNQPNPTQATPYAPTLQTTNKEDAPTLFETLPEQAPWAPPPPTLPNAWVQDTEVGELLPTDPSKPPLPEHYESPAEESSEDFLCESPLHRLESQLDEDWVNPHARKHKYKNKTHRELKSLLKDKATTILTTSSSRRPLRITHHSS